MIPGVNPSQLKQMMRQMGMSNVDVPATSVIIKTPDKEYHFSNPQVQKVSMQGQDTFQIMGSYTTQDALPPKVSISEEDIKMVSEQANVTEDIAKGALEESNGDIAEAIVLLSEGGQKNGG